MAKEVEIMDIKSDDANLRITIEHQGGQREVFSFPLGEGWEDEDDSGNLRAVKNIQTILEQREIKKASVTGLDINAIKARHKNKKIVV